MSITLSPEIDAYAYMDSRVTTIPAWWQKGGWIKGHPENYKNGAGYPAFYLMAANTSTSTYDNVQLKTIVVEGNEKIPSKAFEVLTSGDGTSINNKNYEYLNAGTKENPIYTFKYVHIKDDQYYIQVGVKYTGTDETGFLYFVENDDHNTTHHDTIVTLDKTYTEDYGLNTTVIEPSTNKWYDFWLNIKFNKPIGSQGKIKNFTLRMPFHESNGHIGPANFYAFATTDQTAYFGGVEYNKVSRPRALNELVANAPTDSSILTYTMSNVEIKNNTAQSVTFYFEDFPLGPDDDSIKINFKTTKFCLINYPDPGDTKLGWKINCDFSQDYSIKYYTHPYGTEKNEVFSDTLYPYSDSNAEQKIMSKESSKNQVTAPNGKPYFYGWQDATGKLYGFDSIYTEQQDLELYPVFYEEIPLSALFKEILHIGNNSSESNGFHFSISASTNEYLSFLNNVNVNSEEIKIPRGIKLFNIKLSADPGYSFRDFGIKDISPILVANDLNRLNIDVYANKYLVIYNNKPIGRFYYGELNVAVDLTELNTGNVSDITQFNPSDTETEQKISYNYKNCFIIQDNIVGTIGDDLIENFATKHLVDFNSNFGIPIYVTDSEAFSNYPQSVFKATPVVEVTATNLTPTTLAYKYQEITKETVYSEDITIEYNTKVSRVNGNTALIYLKGIKLQGKIIWAIADANKLSLFLSSGTEYTLTEGDGGKDGDGKPILLGPGEYNFHGNQKLCNKYYSFIKNGTLAQFYIPQGDPKKVNSSFKLKGSYTFYEVPTSNDTKYHIKTSANDITKLPNI